MKDVYPDCDLPCGGKTPCFCALEAFNAECEGVMPLRTGCSMKSLPRSPMHSKTHISRRYIYLTDTVVFAWVIAAASLVLHILHF